MQLTEQYLNEHRANVHTPDSWARTLIGMALEEAAAQVKAGGKDSVEIEAKLVVSPYPPKQCVMVCYSVPGRGQTCVHVERFPYS